MGLQNFPGVYTRVKDDSFFPSTSSRFRCGLVGAAEKGPIDVAVPVNSLRDFHRQFGRSLAGQYLAPAVQLAGDLSDGLVVVRIAQQYEIITGSGSRQATGSSGNSVVTTPNAPLFTVGDYARVIQLGKASTVNARVTAKSPTTLTLSKALAATYVAADVDRSGSINAANPAEAFVKSPVYGSAIQTSGGSPAATKVSGTKSAYELTVESGDSVSGSSPALVAGDVIKITQTGLATTREAMVKRIIPTAAGEPARIVLENINRNDSGFQSTPLQDSYTDASIFIKLDGYASLTTAHLTAANPGTWANSDGSRTGMIVRVSPGTKPDTKKLQVFENSALAEEIDDLVFDSASADYIETRVNGKSSYVTVLIIGSDIEPFENTRDPQSASHAAINVAAFNGGFNGENVTDADYIGTVNVATDEATGLKIFEDMDHNLNLSFIYCPGVTSVNVGQEMDRICRKVNASFILDTLKSNNLRQVTDWHNAVGLWKGNGKLDTFAGHINFNWFDIVDAFSGERITVPPGIGALRCMAYTFDSFKPWFAAAGENRGLIPEAVAVQYPRLSEDAKQAAYGNGNSVNVIQVNRNRIMRYGERTLQRADSKLTAVHSVILVQYVLRGLSERGRKFIFDPIDDILLDQIRAEFNSFLQTIKNERGIEDYNLVLDKTNNTPNNRNNREVIVDLYVIPIDALEKLFINATVRESGASLNAVR